MKIRGFIITGILLLGIGGGVTGYAASRSEFNYEELKDDKYEIETKEFSPEVVQSIHLDINYDNVKIIKNENPSIEIIGKKSKYMHYTYELNEETKELNILQQHKRKWFFGIFEFNPFGIFDKEIKTPFTLSIPEQLLNQLNLTVDAGNVTIEEQNVEQLNLDINAGNVEVNSCHVENAKVKIDAGNFKLQNSYIKDTTIEINAGNLNSNNIESESLSLDVDAGNANLIWKITKNATFKLSAGNIDLTLIGKESDYKINGVGTGDILINSSIAVGRFKHSFKE